MAVMEYSYQFKTIIPLLTEDEYNLLLPKLKKAIDALKSSSSKVRMKNIDYQQSVGEVIDVLTYFEDAYGHKFENVFNLYNVRLSNFGRPCPICIKPFRTPRAKLCAECGYQLPNDEIAGPYPDPS